MVVNFEFLGSEPIENIITCMNFKVDKVIYFGYHDVIQEQKENTDKFLRKYCNVQKTVFHALSQDDLGSVLKTMRKEIENELAQNNNIYFDITGGESLILVAFGMLSREFKAPIHKYDVVEDRLIELTGDLTHRISEEVKTRHIKLNLDMMVEMRGGIINKKLHKDNKDIDEADFASDVDKIWGIAKNNRLYWNPFSDFLKSNMVPDDNLWVNAYSHEIRKALSESKNKLRTVKKLNQILEGLDRAGVILDFECEGKYYSFRFKNQAVKDCIWDGGSILELQFYQKEKMVSDDCEIGVHLDWDGVINRYGKDVLNEIDVLSIKGNIPTFISCKSGRMGAQQSLHALYEIQTVAERFGGKFAKKFLVTVQPLGEVYMERAKEMGISVVRG